MEIYRNRQTTVRIEAPIRGAIYNAVKVSSSAGEDTVFPNYVDNYTPWGVPVLEIPIGLRHILLDGVVTLDITVNDGSGQFSVKENIEVVTPLFTHIDLGDAYEPEKTPELERLVRAVVEAKTGQSFGKKSEAYPVSTGQRIINFDAPLIRFTGVSDRYLTDTTTLSPPKIPFEVMEDRFSVAVDWDSYDVKTDSFWLASNRRPRYMFLYGEFGYDRVPEDVKQAALLIAGMWTDDQSVWRDRYIRTIRSSDWSVQYSGMSYRSTGSVTADMLLESYVRKNQPGLV